MRALCILLVLVCASAANAQPVSYELKGKVPIGQKPVLKVSAQDNVSDVRIELDRHDGKHFSIKPGTMPKGKVVMLPIGDGAAGKASYKGKISAQAGANKWSDDLIFDTLVAAPLKVGYDIDHLDLDKRVLQFKPNRPVESAELVVIGEDGKELGRGSAGALS
jgi:hypothetical protein